MSLTFKSEVIRERSKNVLQTIENVPILHVHSRRLKNVCRTSENECTLYVPFWRLENVIPKHFKPLNKPTEIGPIKLNLKRKYMCSRHKDNYRGFKGYLYFNNYLIEASFYSLLLKWSQCAVFVCLFVQAEIYIGIMDK